MSDKFDMKLVIDPVTTPLLHARLSQAGSARVRAALLRSLAEAALRGSVVASAPAHQIDAHDIEPAGRERSNLQPTERGQPAPAIHFDQKSATDATQSLLVNEKSEASPHDVDQIADAFGSFF